MKPSPLHARFNLAIALRDGWKLDTRVYDQGTEEDLPWRWISPQGKLCRRSHLPSYSDDPDAIRSVLLKLPRPEYERYQRHLVDVVSATGPAALASLATAAQCADALWRLFTPTWRTLRRANAGVLPCRRPCSQCGDGHHWYLDFDDMEAAEDEGAHPILDRHVPVICKHCEVTALVNADAADLPEY